MYARFFMLYFMLLYFSSALYGMDNLPDDIYFKNLKQGFSFEYLYALKDGKIWVKPNSRNTGVEGEWELFDSTGIPHGDDVPSFKTEDQIVQFSTEGTMIAAVSNRGRFYIWQPTLKENTTWLEETGSPFAGPLFLIKNRTWCFSLSTMRAPWKRITNMSENDIVTYWEDIDGNKTEFGFTATIYIVSPDGRKIYYTDTGLPTSWNRAFSSPERGRFVIENMSASASTLFVIDRNGRMFTRMFDFEIEGGCPALRFSYQREKRTKEDEIAPLMTSIRTLPMAGWREQENIAEVLESNRKGLSSAVLTKNITILLTGKGNAARELRVQGRNSKGEYGYWKKMIYASKWDFIATGERFNDNDVIKNYLNEESKGETLDKNYKGKMMKPGEPDINVELLGFYYFDTPAILRVHINNKFFDIEFHTVDLWTPTIQKKYNPELVGNPSGEPKLLQGAIVIPDIALNSSDSDIKEIIDKYFREFNRQAISFKVTADDRHVRIESKVIQRSLEKNLDYVCRDYIEMEFINEEYNDQPKQMRFFTSMAMQPDLEIPYSREFLNKDHIPSIKKTIDLNREALNRINSTNSKLKSENRTSGCANSCILPVYYLFNTLITVTFLPHWDMSGSSPGTAENITQLGGVSYTGGTPIKEYAVMNLNEGFDDSEDYEQAVEIVKSRIAELEKILTELKSK